jgi:superfamily II DNA or RNA helicase
MPPSRHKTPAQTIKPTTESPPITPGAPEIYGVLASDEERNELIIADTLALIDRGRSPIVLTERREQLERLASRLRSRVPSLVTLHGEMRPAERHAALNQLRGSGRHVILATGRYIGEGFDDPRLDALLLAMPIAWKGTIAQYAGRLHRTHPGKRDMLIYDYLDSAPPVLRRMFAKRLKAYTSLGYEVDTGRDEQLLPELESRIAACAECTA